MSEAVTTTCEDEYPSLSLLEEDNVGVGPPIPEEQHAQLILFPDSPPTTEVVETFSKFLTGLTTGIDGSKAAETRYLKGGRSYSAQLDYRVERDRITDYYTGAFKEAKQAQWNGRIVRGPLHGDINLILGRCNELLSAIDERLDPECLMPRSYQSSRTASMVEAIGFFNPNIRREIEKQRFAKVGAIQRLVDNKLPDLMQQDLPEGLLDVPRHRWQSFHRGCAGASFLMVMDAITGERTPVEAFEMGYCTVHNDSAVHDEEFLKLYQTEVFKERFGKDVYTLNFMGADLAFIAKLAANIKQKMPGKRVYCTVSLLSDSSPYNAERGIWHTNVLLGADSERVMVHDPARDTGGPYKSVPKDVFLYRWAQAYSTGNLIIA